MKIAKSDLCISSDTNLAELAEKSLINPSILSFPFYAGESTLSYKVNILVIPKETPLGICTSSATLGPSLSFGSADADCVISISATLADADASSVGNRVKSKKRHQIGIGLMIIICGNDMGAIGDIEFY